MLILLSPAKKLNFKDKPKTDKYTLPAFLDQSEKIMKELKELDQEQIAGLMKINPKLSETNYHRFQSWRKEFNPENARQSVFAFNGDAYRGLKANELSEKELLYAQDHMFILSGLHGYLKPLDLIRPYRLEMGTRLSVGRNKDLYQFWGHKVTDAIKKRKDKLIINLASKEYARVVDFDALAARVVTPDFKEYRNGRLGSFHVLLKHARGLMTKFVIQNQIEDQESLKQFKIDKYSFHDELSSENKFVFIR